MQQRLTTLQNEVTLYRSMLPTSNGADTDSTPLTSPCAVTLSASGVRAPPGGDSFVTAESGSRPVSMVSVTSEKSLATSSCDDDAAEMDDDDDDMLRTLTSRSLSKCSVNHCSVL